MIEPLSRSMGCADLCPDPAGSFEEQRLLDLRSLRVLDTESEERFDRLTQLVAEVLDVPIALVSLIDDRRQWFKSSCGLDRRETARETSFCTHALNEPAMLVVPDAALDPRFASNPFVVDEPRIRFYAGAVLRGPAGFPVGTCCAIDRQPRQLDQRERKFLTAVAALVERELHQTHHLAELRREIERELFRDLATGLANDRLFRYRLERAIEAARDAGEQITVGCIRLGALQEVSAARGLSEAAIISAAMQRLIPLCAAPGSLLARCGRDFGFFLGGAARDQSVALDRMAAALAQPSRFGSAALDLAAVIGVSLFPDDGADPAMLMAAAEAALTMRPAGGSGAIRYHDRAAAAAAASRYSIKYRLRAAIAADRLHMAYQPKVDAHSRACLGAEALLRWTDPADGPVSPLAMIAAAEGSDLIHELGHWVLRRVARQIRDWRQDGFEPGPIAVNLSAPELLHPGLAARISGVLAEFGLAPGALQIEITETALVADFAIAAERIAEMRAMGLAFAIDDFGTGYSSLAYLQRLPFEYLKVDRSFVTDIATNGATAAIVQGIVQLARGLNLKVIAEGVETNAQAVQVRAFGCNQLQGYLFSRPLSAADFRAWSRTAGRAGAPTGSALGDASDRSSR